MKKSHNYISISYDSIINSYDFLRLIMLHTDSKDIIQFCKVNTITRQICSDDYFWKKKVKILKSLDINSDNKPEKLTWKEFYILYSQNKIRLVPVIIFNMINLFSDPNISNFNRIITRNSDGSSKVNIWISYKDTLNKIVFKIFKIIKHIDPNEIKNIQRIYFDTIYSSHSYEINFPIKSCEFINMFNPISTIKILRNDNLFDLVNKFSVYT